MDYKLAALLLLAVGVTFEACEAVNPAAIHALVQLSQGSFSRSKAAAAVHRVKRSADQQEAADQPQNVEKQPVFSGNIIVVGVLSGVAALLCVLALGWSVYMFKFHREDLGATSNS